MLTLNSFCNLFILFNIIFLKNIWCWTEVCNWVVVFNCTFPPLILKTRILFYISHYSVILLYWYIPKRWVKWCTKMSNSSTRTRGGFGLASHSFFFLKIAWTFLLTHNPRRTYFKLETSFAHYRHFHQPQSL